MTRLRTLVIDGHSLATAILVLALTTAVDLAIGELWFRARLTRVRGDETVLRSFIDLRSVCGDSLFVGGNSKLECASLNDSTAYPNVMNSCVVCAQVFLIVTG